MAMVFPEASGTGGEHWGRSRDAVLLVEDEPPMRRIISMCLSRGGYEVLEAASAHLALEILHSRPASIQLLLTDLWMPDMDGFCLIREARRLAPELPIIAMTGMGEHQGREALLASLGIYELLLKPFTPAHLLASAHAAILSNAHPLLGRK